MSNTFKQVIPTANGFSSKKSYQLDHLTTQPFMQISPIFCKEVIPNQKVRIALDSFSRLNPLVKPTFGRCTVNNRFFFVPMRVLMPKFTQFIESEPIHSMVDNTFGLQTSVPVIGNDTMLNYLIGASSSATSSDPYDIAYWTGSAVSYCYLTPIAKYALKVFNSLGYKINFDLTDTYKFSALPLLAFAKVIIDWYYPSQYINNSLITAVEPYLNSDSLSARVVPAAVLGNIIQFARQCSYDDSLFVNAWDRPVGPNNGVESSYSIPDITLPQGLNYYKSPSTKYEFGAVVNSTSNGTPVPENTPLDSPTYPIASSITQYQHDMLKSLTDYTVRHRLSGVRAVDRYLSEYGINLSSEIMKRSILLGNHSYNIQFGDVMAHSDTFDAQNETGARLADYAGKGIGYGNGVFNYDIGNEFGYLMIFNTVVPNVGYYQGVDRMCKHKSILDFYHHDFDGKGVQALASDEVFMTDNYDGNIDGKVLHNQVFGFTPRYSEYKWQPSLQTGLFALRHSNKDLEAFTFMRDLKPNFTTDQDVVHDVNFVQGKDANQYNRVFYFKGSDKEEPENFNFIHHFEIEQIDETCPLYETYDFENVKRAVEVHTQAAKVN